MQSFIKQIIWRIIMWGKIYQFNRINPDGFGTKRTGPG